MYERVFIQNVVQQNNECGVRCTFGAEFISVIIVCFEHFSVRMDLSRRNRTARTTPMCVCVGAWHRQGSLYGKPARRYLSWNAKQKERMKNMMRNGYLVLDKNHIMCAYGFLSVTKQWHVVSTKFCFEFILALFLNIHLF